MSTTKFVLEIDINHNADFKDKGAIEAIADQLADVAFRIRYYKDLDGTVMDTNGNHVGEYGVT